MVTIFSYTSPRRRSYGDTSLTLNHVSKIPFQFCHTYRSRCVFDIFALRFIFCHYQNFINYKTCVWKPLLRIISDKDFQTRPDRMKSEETENRFFLKTILFQKSLDVINFWKNPSSQINALINLLQTKNASVANTNVLFFLGITDKFIIQFIRRRKKL